MRSILIFRVRWINISMRAHQRDFLVVPVITGFGFELTGELTYLMDEKARCEGETKVVARPAVPVSLSRLTLEFSTWPSLSLCLCLVLSCLVLSWSGLLTGEGAGTWWHGAGRNRSWHLGWGGTGDERAAAGIRIWSPGRDELARHQAWQTRWRWLTDVAYHTWQDEKSYCVSLFGVMCSLFLYF